MLGHGALAEFAVAESSVFEEDFAPAEFVLTGAAVSLNVAIAAELAAFAFTGRDTVYALTAEPAGFDLTGIATGGVVLGAAAAAAYSWSGGAATATASLAAGTAPYALAGGAGLFSAVVPLGASSFGFTAYAAELAVPTETANFALSAVNTEEFLGEPLDGASLSLAARSIFRPTAVSASPGESAVAEFGVAEFPRFQSFGLFAASTSFTMLASDVALASSPEAAAFALGTAAAEMAMPAAEASFAVAGQEAMFVRALERALFSLGGIAAARVDWLGVGPGSFSLSGQPSAFDVLFGLATGSYSLRGFAIADVVAPTGNRIYLIEVQAHDGTQLQTFYLGTEGFITAPDDAPANQYYDPRVMDPGNFERALFQSADLRGRARAAAGDIRIATGDPGHGVVLDDWFSYGWSQRDIRIKSLPKGARSLSEASTLFVGKLARASSQRPLETIDLSISDRLSDLEQPLLTERFAGTTTESGATAEGNADLAGTLKQQCFGNCRNVPLQPANPYDLIYLVSNGEVASIAVNDLGLALTNDGDDADLATLHAASVAAGHYRTCLALGLVKLGVTPDFPTADVVEGADAEDRTAGQISYRMLIGFGIASNLISSGHVDILDAANDAECGYFVSTDRDALAAVQDVLDSIGAWMVPNLDGTLIFGRFGAPVSSTQSIFELDDQAIADNFSRVGNDLPAWRVILEYGPVVTVQNGTNLSDAVTAATRATLAKEFRTVVAEDASVKTKHLSAREVTIRTWLIDPDAAQAEATRQLDLLKADRQRYDVTFPLSDAFAHGPGDSIALEHPRLGLSSGKAFNIMRRIDNYSVEKVQLSLWG